MKSGKDATSMDQAVRERIFSGELKPGGQIVESRLAAALGVSRSPVRESLSRLVGQGVLRDSGRWQGVRLREYTVDEVVELYEHREAIEGQAARLAAIRATTSDLQRLAVAFEQLDEMADDDLYGSPRWSVVDERFHRLIVEFSRNSRFISAFDSIFAESRFAFYQNPLRVKYLAKGNARLQVHRKQIKAEHRRIYDALMARQPEEAERAVRDALVAAAEIMTYLFALEEVSESEHDARQV